MRKAYRSLTILILGIAASASLAATIPNWSAPSTWTPSGGDAAAKTGVKTAFAMTYPPVPLIPLTPCRLADTRAGSGYPAGYGPPSLPGGSQRTFTITGQCGIPTGANAVSFNFTIWGPVTRGDLRVWPTGGAAPMVSTVNWEANILAIANAAVVPLSGGGEITVQVDGTGTIDLIIDVNGYYSTDISAAGGGPVFYLNSSSGYTIWGNNTKSNGIGVVGYAAGSANSTGVFGESNGTGSGVKGISSAGIGTHGVSNSFIGAKGFSDNHNGVWAESTTFDGLAAFGGRDGTYSQGGRFGSIGHSVSTATDLSGVLGYDGVGVNNPPQGWFSAGVRGEGKNGVLGISSTIGGAGVVGQHLDSGGNDESSGYLGVPNSGAVGTAHGTGLLWGVYGYFSSSTATAESSGVYGFADGTSSARVYGVFGDTPSTVNISAGVQGRAGTAAWTSPLAATLFGVRGLANRSGYAVGVIGEGTGEGVHGIRVNSSGVEQTTGILGFSGTSGVHSYDDITAVGTKSFVEPHPADPARQIVFVAMEGPEAGTYFRGRGRFQRGTAIIVVPETFRLVTEEEGLTVQVTPIGRATAVGVLSMSLTQIEVEADKDVEFSYLVQGVRKGYADMRPVQENVYFVPSGPTERMGPYPDRIRQRLVSLGIYHADGTVNLENAERMGWAKKWRDQERLRQEEEQARPAISRAPQASEPSARR